MPHKRTLATEAQQGACCRAFFVSAQFAAKIVATLRCSWYMASMPVCLHHLYSNTVPISSRDLSPISPAKCSSLNLPALAPPLPSCRSSFLVLNHDMHHTWTTSRVSTLTHSFPSAQHGVIAPNTCTLRCTNLLPYYMCSVFVRRQHSGVFGNCTYSRQYPITSGLP